MKFLTTLATVSTLVLATSTVPVSSSVLKRQSPSSGSGWEVPERWLTIIPSSNLGEPLNVIISNASSAAVLSDPAPYFSSLFYSPNSCLGFNLGGPQAANLNDGQGVVNQTGLYRYNFNNGVTTCEQSLNGGMHFRYWVQDTTGALFLAVSLEESAAENHMISPNGYNLGRNWLVGNATNSSGTTSPQDGSKYSTSRQDYDASSDISQSDINHAISSDGQIFILTVTQTEQGDGTDVTSDEDPSSTGGAGGSSSAAGRIPSATLHASVLTSILATLLVGSLLGGLSLLTISL